MHEPGTSLADLLVTIIVFLAILALFTEYARVVIAATLFVVIWQLVVVFGPGLQLATMLVSLAIILRTLALLATDMEFGRPLLAQALDVLLTPRQAGDDDEFGRRLRQEDAEGRQRGLTRFDDDRR